MRRSKNRRNCLRKPIFAGCELRGRDTAIDAISTAVSTETKAKVTRQPKVLATQVPAGTPTTEAMEKPENTQAMNLVRYLSVVTSGAKVMEMATSVPDTEAMSSRAMSSTG